MTFHDTRLQGAVRGVTNRRRCKVMLKGAARINIWQTLGSPKAGSVADDWKAVGKDLKAAMTVAAKE